MNSTAAEWIVRLNDKNFGPYRLDQLRQLAERGKIDPETLVIKQGSKQWLSAKSLPGLFGQSNSSQSMETNPVAGSPSPVRTSQGIPAGHAAPSVPTGQGPVSNSRNPVDAQGNSGMGAKPKVSDSGASASSGASGWQDLGVGGIPMGQFTGRPTTQPATPRVKTVAVGRLEFSNVIIILFAIFLLSYALLGLFGSSIQILQFVNAQSAMSKLDGPPNVEDLRRRSSETMGVAVLVGCLSSAIGLLRTFALVGTIVVMVVAWFQSRKCQGPEPWWCVGIGVGSLVMWGISAGMAIVAIQAEMPLIAIVALALISGLVFSTILLPTGFQLARWQKFTNVYGFKNIEWINVGAFAGYVVLTILFSVIGSIGLNDLAEFRSRSIISMVGSLLASLIYNGGIGFVGFAAWQFSRKLK